MNSGTCHENALLPASPGDVGSNEVDSFGSSATG